jgi:hypothetical protein
MTFDRPSTRAAFVAPCLLTVLLTMASGCGDYSNEDLEFMNALPERGMGIVLPDRSSAVSAADEAELARSTHDVTRLFNGMLGALVSIVDGIRSYPPTTRRPDGRIWGPYPDVQNPGWQSRLIISRDPVDVRRFDYELALHLAGGDDLDWPVFIRGWFEAGHTAGRGAGHVEMLTAALRAEGRAFPELDRLDHLEVDYATADEPIWIDMTVTNLPDPARPAAATMARYAYLGASGGQGQFTFDLFGNFILLTPAEEELTITSQWLGTGEGVANLTVASGDGKGATQHECWDRTFRATFNRKTWTAAEDIGTDPSVCLEIPLLTKQAR